MKNLLYLISILLILGISINCNAGQRKDNIEVKQDSTELSKQTMAYPEEYVDWHPPGWDVKPFARYEMMIIDSINHFHRVNGRMPDSLTDFFYSDFCFVLPREIKSGLLFKEADSLDMNHPEYLVYENIDEDTAKLSFLLRTVDDVPYIYTYRWNRERFWAFFPRDAEGKDAEEWEKRVKTKPPTTSKKAKEMLDHFAGMFGWAMADYFDDHSSFPEDFDSLFKDKWGIFRKEPWHNFEYDDPVNKLPDKIFGFDKSRNAYYVHSIWENFEYETATLLPANFVELKDKPLNMRKVKDIDSLNIEIFADVEILRNL